MPLYLDVLGLVACAITSLAFAPQVWKIYRTKSGRDVSYRMFGLLAFGVILWLVYGFLIRSLPLIVTNIVTLCLALAVIALKIRYH